MNCCSSWQKEIVCDARGKKEKKIRLRKTFTPTSRGNLDLFIFLGKETVLVVGICIFFQLSYRLILLISPADKSELKDSLAERKNGGRIFFETRVFSAKNT